MVPDGRVPAPGCRFGKLPGVRSASTKAHVHPTADVAADAKIGTGTRVWNQAQIREGAVIGSECVVGKFAMIGAGAVVTKRVPPHRLAYGNPARVHGYVCRCGNRLEESGKGFNPCLNCGFELQVSD